MGDKDLYLAQINDALDLAIKYILEINNKKCPPNFKFIDCDNICNINEEAISCWSEYFINKGKKIRKENNIPYWG